jgi:aminoglycoside phosphotransferase (APT) family kinase protein
MQVFYHPCPAGGCYNFIVTRPLDHLPQETALALLEKIAPGSSLWSVELLPGSFSNHTHLLEAHLPDGGLLKCVVRRYQVFGDYDRGEKARREFKAFELMNRSGIPSPEPLFLDETGELLGVPGIVTSFVPGKLVLDAPSEPLIWARKLAVMLAKIHAIPLDEVSRSFLLDANAEATWFLKSDSAPEYMQVYPGGADLWQALLDRVASRRPVPPALVHIDYWSGNILWYNEEISAVLDWEEAACGDPVIDVAYARMNMVLMGLPAAADEFLRIYETEIGRKVENLGFWEMAAAVRPMVDLPDWQVDREPKAGRFQQFMGEARRRM